jgi:hypothetical protein
VGTALCIIASEAPVSTISSPAQVAASLIECWSPRVVAKVDGAYIKIAKVKVLTWHCHDNEDEPFLIL